MTIAALEQQVSRLTTLLEHLRNDVSPVPPHSSMSPPDSDSSRFGRDSDNASHSDGSRPSYSAHTEQSLINHSLSRLDLSQPAPSLYKHRQDFLDNIRDELQHLRHLVRGGDSLPVLPRGNEPADTEHTDCNGPRDQADADALLDDALDFHDFQGRPKGSAKDFCWPCHVQSGDKSTLLRSHRLRKIDRDHARFDLMTAVPSQKQSNVLFRSWMTSVHPVLPTSPIRMTITRYLRFWEWKVDIEKGLTEDSASPDLLFMPMLFAMWYTGALSLSKICFGRLFPGTTRASVCSQLHDQCVRALAMISFPGNGQTWPLAAFVTLQSVPCSEEEPLQSSDYMNLMVRYSQALGNHREPTLAALHPFDAETRRRVWWQILQLDTSLAVSSGFPASTSESTADARPVSLVKEMFIGSDEEKTFLDLSSSAWRKIESVDEPFGKQESILSVSALVQRTYATIALATRKIVAIHMRTKPVSVEDLREMNLAITTAEDEVRVVINSIPTKGVPELGFTPTEPAVYVPEDTDLMLESLPTDAEITFHTGILTEPLPGPIGRFHRQRLAAFHKWSRIWLSMMCDKMHCIAYAPFLKNVNSKLWSGGRQCALHHCSAFFRKFISLATDPTLEPFRWNWPGTAQSMHAAIVLLVDLYERPFSVEAARSRTLIDQVFSLSAPENGIIGGPDGVSAQRPMREGGADAWEMLRNLRASAWKKAGLDPDVLWTEEQQIHVGAAQPLTAEQRIARSIREDTMYDTVSNGDDTSLNRAVNTMLSGVNFPNSDGSNGATNGHKPSDTSTKAPARLPGQQAMPFPLRKKHKAQATATAPAPGTIPHIEANRYQGNLPDEVQDSQTYASIGGHRPYPQIFCTEPAAAPHNKHNGEANAPPIHAANINGRGADTSRSTDQHQQSETSAQRDVTMGHNGTQALANGVSQGDGNSTDVEFDFDWNAWDAVFNQYGGYADFMDDFDFHGEDVVPAVSAGYEV